MKFTSTVALMACMLAASGLRVEAKRRVDMGCPMFMAPLCKDGEVYGKKQWGNIPNCYQTICVKPRVIELGQCPNYRPPLCDRDEYLSEAASKSHPGCFYPVCKARKPTSRSLRADANAKRRVGMGFCPMFMVPQCKDGEVYGKKQWGNIPNCYQTICVKPRSLRSMGDPLFPAATECRQRCNEYRKKKMRYICLSDCIF